MTTPNSLPIAQNSFDSIVINGLVYRKEPDIKEFESATLDRAILPVNLIDPYPHPDLEKWNGRRPDECYEPGGPISRSPSTLPPPAHSTLSFSIGEAVGCGRSGIIFDAADVCVVPRDGNEAPTGYLPPLVVKIGRSNRCYSIAREAWFYEEMESIQGIAIARCYGCFKMKLPRGRFVYPWQEPLFATEDDDDRDEFIDFDEYPNEALRETGVAPHPLLAELIRHDRYLFVLVLECLGPRLPTGIWHPEDVQKDIKGVYDNLGALGVQVGDSLISENILAAPCSPPGIPSQLSPFTHRTHAWRAIDFESAFKVPYTREVTRDDHDSWLTNMFYALPYIRSRRPDADSRSPSPESDPTTPEPISSGEDEYD